MTFSNNNKTYNTGKRVEILSTKWKTRPAKIKAIPNTPG